MFTLDPLAPPPTPNRKGFGSDPSRNTSSRLSNSSTLQTNLDLPGGEAFILVNGGQTAYPRQGQTYLALSSVKAANGVEGQILRATPGGLWTFDLSAAQAAVPSSLRVLLGDVARITPTSITSRLSGTPGERVAFTFAGK